MEGEKKTEPKVEKESSIRKKEKRTGEDQEGKGHQRVKSRSSGVKDRNNYTILDQLQGIYGSKESTFIRDDREDEERKNKIRKKKSSRRKSEARKISEMKEVYSPTQKNSDQSKTLQAEINHKKKKKKRHKRVSNDDKTKENNTKKKRCKKGDKERETKNAARNKNGERPKKTRKSSNSTVCSEKMEKLTDADQTSHNTNNDGVRNNADKSSKAKEKAYETASNSEKSEQDETDDYSDETDSRRESSYSESDSSDSESYSSDSGESQDTESDKGGNKEPDTELQKLSLDKTAPQENENERENEVVPSYTPAPSLYQSPKHKYSENVDFNSNATGMECNM